MGRNFKSHPLARHRQCHQERHKQKVRPILGRSSMLSSSWLKICRFLRENLSKSYVKSFLIFRSCVYFILYCLIVLKINKTLRIKNCNFISLLKLNGSHHNQPLKNPPLRSRLLKICRSKIRAYKIKTVLFFNVEIK